MLGALLLLVILAGAAYAVTQVGGLVTLAFIGAVLFLAYKRLNLFAFTVTFTVLLAVYTAYGAQTPSAGVWKGFLWLLLAGLALLNVRPLRRALITRPFMKTYLRLLPAMSQTEREALEAGTVWWDGELFTGAPRWAKLLAAKPPRLSTEEEAFLDGPCEELCRMIDEWETTHERADLSREVWDYLKSKGFFAMIIPKKYGGLEFSAYAHSCVLAKIASRSATASSTVAVPNSLGAPEPLWHRGAEDLLAAAPRAR
jgi:acyl-CoA dehydrogenase